MAPADDATMPALAGIPQLGFGVFQVPPQDTAEIVGLALETGYRHIDTAAAYRNERGVGEAVRSSGLPREEVFVTTKVWNSSHGRAEAGEALSKSLGRLGLDYVDLYLIHWPTPARDRYVETWEALIEARAQGLANQIGVCNFQPAHLDRIVAATGVTPVCNQVELHAHFQQRTLREVHERLGIVTESWSPLGRGRQLADPVISGIATDLGRDPGQIAIRWHLQHGFVVIPKSVTPVRIRSNFDVLSFELSDDQMAALDALDDPGGRLGPDPDTFEMA